MKGSWDGDRDPLAALRRGETRLFEAFVAQEVATFLGFFTRQGASLADAEDLVQETFLKMYQSAARYEPAQRFGPYAFRIARNAWIDHRRRRASRPSAPAGPLSGSDEAAPADHPADPARRADEALVDAEDAERLSACLLQLPEAQRIVVELGLFQELPYPQIAGVLEIPVGTVKSRMFHAVRKLRELMDADGPGRDKGGAR